VTTTFPKEALFSMTKPAKSPKRERKRVFTAVVESYTSSLNVDRNFMSAEMDCVNNARPPHLDMKFLVSAESVDYGGPVSPKDVIAFFENLVIPSFQMIEKWEKEGKIIGGGFAGQRAGCFIMEAASTEELSRTLSTLPLWGVTKWDIRAMVSISSVLSIAREQANGMKAMAAHMP
jgi:hypothetical protein